MPVGNIPVVVNSFNQPTYLMRMVSQLQSRGVENILILDQASTYPPLVEYLASVEEVATVVRLAENRGPHWFFTSGLYRKMPRYFVYTDPDIGFSETLPHGFLGDMVAVANSLSAAKVGLALDISSPDALIPATVEIDSRSYTIPEWEAQFWANRIPNPWFEVYAAPVDTTFALYDRAVADVAMRSDVTSHGFYCMDTPHSYRLAGAYTATHLPWMRDDPIPKDELGFYLSARAEIHSY